MMAAETMKDYLVGIGFDLDEGGAAKADAALNQLEGILKSLGKVLETTATAIRDLLTEFRGGTGEIDQSANALDAASDAAQELTASETSAAQAAGQMAEANAAAAASTDNLADKTQQAASTSDKAEKSFRKANKAAKMDNAKKGAENVSQLDEKMKKASDTVKAFIGAATAMLVGSGIASFVSDTYKLTESLATSAKSMKKSYEEARAYSTALATMGKTADEIAQSDSLKQTFNDLQAIGKQIALPETAQGLKGISDLKEGLVQLKFVGNYAMQWLMYKIQTVAEGPLTQVRNMVTGIRDWFAGNIEKVAEGVARAFGNVVQLFMSLGTAVKTVVGWIGELPPAIKIAGAAILAVIAVVKSKFALITVIVTVILLLIDDFVTYMQGGDSLFGGFWGKCIEWIEKIQPAIDTLIGWLNDFCVFAGEVISGVITWIQNLWNKLNENGAIADLSEAFSIAFENIKTVVGIVSDAISSLFSTTEDGEAGSVSVWESIGDAVSGLNAIAAKVMLWVEKLIQKILSVEGVKETIQGVVDAIWGIVSGAVELISGVINGIVQLLNGDFAGAWETIKTAASGAWESIKTGAESLWEGLSTLFAPVAEWLSGVFTSAKDWIVEAWSTVVEFFQGIWDGIVGVFTSASEWFKGIFDDASSAVTGAFDTVVTFFTGIWEGITGAFSSALTFFQGVASNIYSGITNITEDVGSWFSTNIWSPIKNTFNDALSFFTGIAGNVWSGITSGFESIGSWFTDNVWTPITNVFSIDGIVSFFKGVATNIWDGLTGGLEEKVGSVTETVKGFFSNVWDGVLNFFGIKSPSKLAQDAGENVMEGFGNGTEGKQASITEKVKGVFSTIWEGAKSVWDGVTGWLGKLFGWSDDDEAAKNTAQSEVSTAAGEVASAVTDSFTDVETAISEPIVNGTTTATTAFTDLQTTITTVMAAIQMVISNAVTQANTSLTDATTMMSTMKNESVNTASGMTTSFNTIVSEAKKLANGITNAIKNLPTDVQSTFTALANSMTSTFNTAASSVISQVNNIKNSLASIPRTISVTVSAKKAFSFGGVVDRETDAKIGEDGREYVIPVTKPSRAISLLRSAAADLGMTVQSTKEAASALGGSADRNVTPVYATTGGNSTNTVNNNTQVSSNATIHVHGTNAQSIANNVAKNQERIVLRNIKTAFA